MRLEFTDKIQGEFAITGGVPTTTTVSITHTPINVMKGLIKRKS